ncbi:E3 ubiquitin-protein ligase ubr2 [Aphanomyces cochlioides]|nr:E3 ubiquitin-protein ligase ubr2 [Aphanomyces cochlioides]
MAQWTTPMGLGVYVEQELKKGSTDDQILPEGWMLQLLENGHRPEDLKLFVEAILAAAIRILGDSRYQRVDQFLRDLHAQHDRLTPKSGVCGYMFKNNDIAWNCRTCQADDTCVLCQTCFQNSNHEGHEVFFHRTAPGGMCDCGDVEAWKPEGFCKDHTGSAESDHKMELPAPFDRIIRSVIAEFVRFITFVAQHSIDSFDDFKVAEIGEAKKRHHLIKHPGEPNPKIFHARISNDDVHTDEDLVNCLVAKNFPLQFAEEFTHSVDGKGSGMLKENQTLADALGWMRQMKEATWFASVVDNDHIKYEKAWNDVFNYLVSIFAVSTSVQSILFDQLFRKTSSAVYKFDRIPLALLLQSTPHLKKELVKGMKQLYLAIMGSKELKMQFAPLYARVYSRLMMQYFCGIGTERENIFGLGVQIFTTPSIVYQLETEFGLWDTVLTTLQEAMSLAVVRIENDTRSVYNAAHMAIKYRRYYPLLQDVNHLLMIPNMSVKFAESYASCFMDVLKDTSHINLQSRVPEHRPHVEREDNSAWIASFTLCMHLDGYVLPNMYKSLRSQQFDESVLWTLFDAFYKALNDFSTAAGLTYNPKGFVSYSLASMPVSFHYPLNQAWGRFVLEMLHRDLFVPVKSRMAQKSALIDALLEFPLRSFVLSSQVASNMWVRNGKDMMVRQVTSYYSLSSNLSFRDLDLTTIQFCLLLLGPTKFVSVFFDRYDIVPYLAKGDSWLNKVSMEKRALYVAECLLKLLWIALELPPAPNQSITEYLRRDVLHMIMVKPHVFSHLREQTNPIYCNPGLELINDDTKNRELINLLQEIADLQTSSNQDMAPSKFALKSQFYKEYDPSYFHVSPVNHVEAQVARQDVVFKQWTPEKELIPTVYQMPNGHPQFLECRKVLVEAEVFDFIRACLNDGLIQGDENVLSRILHILTVQLYMADMDSSLTPFIRDQICKGPTESDGDKDGSKRQKVDSAGPTAIHDQSILVHLTKRAQQYKSQAEASHKPQWSAILFVLKAYMAFDPTVASFLEEEVFPKKEETSNAPLDAAARRELQKKRQQEAMAKMMKQQSSFAAQLEDEDDEMDTDEGDNAPSCPECIICALVKKDDPVMYVGLLQKTPFRFKSTGVEPMERGDTMHVQLCGHAVHLSCIEQYTATMRREIQLGMAHSTIAFDPAAGEFLCPLCKALCSTCLPHVTFPASAAAKMEHFFQRALDPDALTDWLTQTLPSHIRARYSEPQDANAQPDAIQSFAESFFPPSVRGTDELLEKPKELSQLLLRTVANVFHMSQLQGFSAAMCHLVLNTTGEIPLAARFGRQFSSDAEALIDPFGPRDDTKLHAIFMVLTQLRQVFATADDYWHYLPLAVEANFADADPSLFFMGLSLFEHDLFSVLLVICSCLKEKSDMLWTIRLFCALHMTQVLLQTMQPLPPHRLETGEVDNATPYALLRDQFAQAAGLSISADAPSGAILNGLFEANCNEFLRKSMLLVRAIFRGWNDPDSAMYLNFCSTLRLSTDFKQHCGQLGVPDPITLLQPGSPWATQMLQIASRAAKVPPLSLLVNKDSSLWAAHVPIIRFAPVYTDFYSQVASVVVCVTTGVIQEAPAICLLCGDVVCGGTECCKRRQRGACSQHVPTCGCGQGAFFLIRQCQMLLVSTAGRSCFFPSPYVDEFGEEDHNVRRGRPLFLRPNRYLALMQLVFSHSIASEVSKNRRTSEQYIRVHYY